MPGYSGLPSRQGIRDDFEKLVDQLPTETHVGWLEVIPLDENGEPRQETLLNKVARLLDGFKKFFLAVTGLSPHGDKTSAEGNIYFGKQQ